MSISSAHRNFCMAALGVKSVVELIPSGLEKVVTWTWISLSTQENYLMLHASIFFFLLKNLFIRKAE